MHKKLFSLCLVAGLATGAFAVTAQAAMAGGCRSTDGGTSTGPYYGGDPMTYGWIGVGDGTGNHLEVNGGLESSPTLQVERGGMGYGGYYNSDGEYGEC
jgi:hypothetical protein